MLGWDGSVFPCLSGEEPEVSVNPIAPQVNTTDDITLDSRNNFFSEVLMIKNN